MLSASLFGRFAALLAALPLITSCASVPRASSHPPPQPLQLSARIAGRPFVARAALMIATNDSVTGSSSRSPGKVTFERSTLKVYERTVTCAENQQPDGPPTAAGERVVSLTLEGHWPYIAGSAWQVPEPQKEPGAPGISGTFDVEGDGGSEAYGTARVLAATADDGAIEVNLAANPQSSDATAMARGVIPFVVCR